MSRWFRSLTARAAQPQPATHRMLNIRYYTDYPTCNLSCSYCIAGHGDKSPKPQSQWDEQRFLAIVDNIGKLPYDVNIRFWVGGEFFVSRTLVDAARRLSHRPNIVSVNLVTNLTLLLKQYEKLFSGYRMDKVAVVTSFHPTEIKDHEAWFDKAVKFHSRLDFAVCLVAFPICYNPPLSESSKGVASKSSSNPISASTAGSTIRGTIPMKSAGFCDVRCIPAMISNSR
jgi:hypothetical protein